MCRVSRQTGDIDRMLSVYRLRRWPNITSTFGQCLVYAGMRLAVEPHDLHFVFCVSQGQVLVNAFNLGRYWPVRGPQVTLYVPAPVLLPYPQSNTIIIMELDNAPCGTEQSNCSVTLTDEHVIDGPVDS